MEVCHAGGMMLSWHWCVLKMNEIYVYPVENDNYFDIQITLTF